MADDFGRPGPDPATVAAFRSGDLDALASICDRYQRTVWAVALTVLADRHLAEDAAQETFLRAWRSRTAFDPGRPFTPWLMTIARRTALDVRRRESLPHRGGHEPEQDLAVQPPSLERVWEAAQIRLALDQLPDNERQVIRMAHFTEMTYPEIAAALGVPLGTVKTRAWRAHRKLAVMLEHVIDDARGEARS